LIAAEYNGVAVNIGAYKEGDNKTAAFKAMSPLGKLPVLQTSSGCITESNAIARYVARLRNDTGLYGSSFFESAQVDQWVDFCSHDIELPASLWFYPVIGKMPANPAAKDQAKRDFARALNVLEAHLSDKTYLVGQQITLAEITVVTTLVYPFKFVADAAYRAAFPNVGRWFNTCVNQAEFQAVIGSVALCTVEMTEAGVAEVAASAAATPAASQKGKGGDNKKGGDKGGDNKKDKAPKEPKVEKPKVEKAPKVEKPKVEKPPKEEEEDDFDDTPKEKKEDHAFRLLDKSNPSAFIMDTWKKTYSNCEGDYVTAMNTFWSLFDAEGWSLWRGDYQYNEENKVLFMTSNLIGGFIQRTEEIRKWLFGCMTIRGEAGVAGGMKVTCFYLIRGQDIKPLIDCNTDAECYTWTKFGHPASDAEKAALFEYWTSDTTLEGEPCLDSRCYK